MTGVSVAEAITQETGVPSRVKWPNDVMLGERKVCGILTETPSGEPEAATIVGVGINVNVDPGPAGLPPTATSLLAELGRGSSRADLFAAIITRLDGYLVHDPNSVRGDILDRWRGLLWRRNQVVRLADQGLVIEGVIEEVTAMGSLLLRVATGETREITTGELLL